MTKIKSFIALSALFVLSSCGAGMPSAGSAAIVLAQDSVAATKDSEKESTKTGMACTTNILNLVTSGDASVEAAARNGNIKTITSIDRDIKGWNIYIALGKSCTIVKGH